MPGSACGTSGTRRGVPAAIGVAVLAFLALASSSALGQEKVGLGGGSSFPEGAVVAVAQGSELPPLNFLFAQNTGSAPAEVELRVEAPAGIEVRAERTKATLAPEEQVEFRFGVAVAASVPAGDHTILVQAVQMNAPPPKPGEVAARPGVGAHLVLRVVGETGRVSVRAVSKAGREPLAGVFKLSALTGENRPVDVRKVEGTELAADVGPGRYRATFTIPELASQHKDVTVTAGRTKRVEFVVDTVFFSTVGAKAITEGGKVVFADLVAVVLNRVGPIPGDVRIRAIVRRDGRRVTSVELRRQDGLPAGTTEARQNYRPPGGWTPGRYQFTFEVVTPKFTVQSGRRPVIKIPAPFPWLMVGGGAAVLVVLVVLVMWRRGRSRGSGDRRGPSAGAHSARR